MCTIDSTIFQQLFPKARDPALWASTLNLVLPSPPYEINSPRRVAAFLGQCGHESAGWTVFEENLNYSAERLQVVFKKYFPDPEIATSYARNPVKIGSKVYAGRMGNGDEASGDGYKYRGRGLIQLTGRSNYAAFARAVGQPDIVDNPDMVRDDKVLCIESALWYWNSKTLNTLADKEDHLSMTKKINGGTHGLIDRISRYQAAMKLLS